MTARWEREGRGEPRHDRQCQTHLPRHAPPPERASRRGRLVRVRGLLACGLPSAEPPCTDGGGKGLGKGRKPARLPEPTRGVWQRRLPLSPLRVPAPLHTFCRGTGYDTYLVNAGDADSGVVLVPVHGEFWQVGSSLLPPFPSFLLSSSLPPSPLPASSPPPQDELEICYNRSRFYLNIHCWNDLLAVRRCVSADIITQPASPPLRKPAPSIACMRALCSHRLRVDLTGATRARGTHFSEKC